MVKSLSTIIMLCLLIHISHGQKKDGLGYHYTYEAIEANVEGKVYLAFGINKDGKILRDSIIVVRGLGYGLDQIAVEVLAKAPDWKPMTKKMIEKTGGFQRFSIQIEFTMDQIKKQAWSEYHTIKAQRNKELGDNLSAIDSLKKALEYQKKNKEALELIVALLREAGRLDESKKYKSRLKRATH